MRFAVCVMADIDEIGFFSHAEALGYDLVCVTGSQMLLSDCYAVLALVAQQTRRIRLELRRGRLVRGPPEPLVALEPRHDARLGEIH